MAHVVADRVLETSTTTGTGTYTLAGAVTGFRTFAGGGAANGDTCYYYAEDVDASGVPNGGWEAGIGTWGTGAALARTTVLASSNSNAAVSWSAGTRRIGLGMQAKNSSADIQTFSASGTWTKPAGAKDVEVLMWSTGGGGGSGARQASGTGRAGGGSGAGGAFAREIIPASLLGTTESVVPGVGGAGGAAVSANSTNGNSGSAGDDTSFGTWLRIFGGGGAGGGTTSGSTNGSSSGTLAPNSQGTNGTSGATTTGVNGFNVQDRSGPSGGSGAGTTGAGTQASGGVGGGCSFFAFINSSIAGGTAGDPAATMNAGAGSSGQSIFRSGSGGGGGAYKPSTAGGAGGVGGFPAGGGGGGGASDNGFNSGAGGKGGDGLVIVISHF